MSYSDGNSYNEILNRALDNDLLISVDKRQGSVVYDTLAPVCLELANAYNKMDILASQSLLMSATGTNLDKKAYDYGVIRTEATKSLRIGTFKKYATDDDGNYILDDEGNKTLTDIEIPEGSRFVIPETEENVLYYTYIGVVDNQNVLQCESEGTQGDAYTGTILPVSSIPNLIEAKLTSSYTPAEDEETDDELRQRVVDTINTVAFGGNIDDYIEKVNAITGVGNCKIFPAWQYNGSVLISVVDTSFNPISDAFANQIKEELDPSDESGEGLGIAPIGHYVTITTPVNSDVKVTMTVTLESDYTIGEVQEDIEEKVKEYFTAERAKFAQDKTLNILRARITEAVLKVEEVANVTDVLLNDVDADIILTDSAGVNLQYLPNLSEVVIN